MKSDSVKRMMDEFMKCHNNGNTIPEIAKRYRISSTTIYSYLGIIAEKNGVSRESLLQIPHKPHRKPIILHPRKKRQTLGKVADKKQEESPVIKQEENTVIEHEENTVAQPKENPVTEQPEITQADVRSIMEEYKELNAKVSDMLNTVDRLMENNRRK